jgi:hypothetical protein
VQFVSWEKHLANVCDGDQSDAFEIRRARILEHIARYQYPALTNQERHAIRVIAESLYESIKMEAEKALSMYRKLDAAFVRQGRPFEADIEMPDPSSTGST